MEEFIKEIGNPLYVPFIPKDANFNKKSDDYDSSCQKMRSVWNSIYEKQLAAKHGKRATSPPAEPVGKFLQKTNTKIKSQLSDKKKQT